MNWSWCHVAMHYFQPVHGTTLRASKLSWGDIPPRKLTWNLKMMVSNRNLLFQGFIFRFHLSFPGCIALQSRKNNKSYTLVFANLGVVKGDCLFSKHGKSPFFTTIWDHILYFCPTAEKANLRQFHHMLLLFYKVGLYDRYGVNLLPGKTFKIRPF